MWKTILIEFFLLPIVISNYYGTRLLFHKVNRVCHVQCEPLDFTDRHNIL